MVRTASGVAAARRAHASCVGIYAIRHGVYALTPEIYEHESWGYLFFYETLKVLLYASLWLCIIFGLESFARWQREREQLLALQKHLAESQLAQLRAQLQPHFLFNALNTISSLMQVDVARADRLLTQLADLLRASLQTGAQHMTSLRHELELLELVRAIMQERFAGRVTLDWNIADDTLDATIPAMLLQPLLENAFKHGVERSTTPVAIRIVMPRRDGRKLTVTVRNGGTLAADGRRRHRPHQLPRAARTALRRRCDARSRAGRRRCRLDGSTCPQVDGPMIRMLIVDDEAPARDKLRRWLAEDADIEIVGESADGLAAAASIAGLAPDVVFLDIQMPGLVRPRSRRATRARGRAAHRLRDGLRRARDRGVRPQRRRLSTETLRPRSAAQDARPAAPAATRAGGTTPPCTPPASHLGSSERLLVPQGDALQLIDTASIHWLEADDNYVHVHTARGALSPAPHAARPARAARRALRAHPQIRGREPRSR